MRFQTLTINTSLFVLALGQSNFASVCPGKDDGKAYEINPGYWVEYKCDTIGPFSGNAILANSPQECAELCANSATSCGGSSWGSTDQKCLLDLGGGQSISFQDSVYMKKVPAPPPPANPYNPYNPAPPQQPVGTCPNDLTKCEDDLAQCQLDLTTAQSATTLKEVAAVCDSGDGKVAVIHGKQYRVWCKANLAHSSGTITLTNVPDLNTCGQLCSAKPEGTCTRALWRSRGGVNTCLLMKDNQDPNVKPGRTTGFDTLIRL